MCLACSNIPKLKSFRKRILLRTEKAGEDTGKRDRTRVRNEYLTSKEMVQKLKEQKEKLDQKDDKLFFITSTAVRLRIRAGSLRDKLREYSRRGSVKAVCFKLQKAADLGLLDDKTTLKAMLETVSRNLHVKTNGKRYQPSFKLFLEVLLMLGGPRIATFVAINLGGPEIHSIYRWRNQHSVDISGGIQQNNFKKLGPVYKEAMAKIKSCSVPVLAAEDETAIIGHATYHQNTDELFGFCGVNGQQHACLDHFAVVVGDGEEGFTSIVNAFKEYKIGTYGRAILLNPLHPNLPRIAVLVMPTCNRFDHQFVYRQWQEVKRLYDQELKNIVGPLIGNSSDGDSRRRKLMLQLATVDVGYRFKPIPRNLGFIFSCKKVDTENGYEVEDMCDQDYVHNHKKLLNPLDHASRVLRMDDYLVHMNHLQLVSEVFPFPDHGLGLSDIERRDRQNWRSAQKLTFPKVQRCLEALINGTVQGRPPDITLLGTKTYLLIIWYYVEIFCSCVASLTTRITYAAIVTHFLAIWRNWIYRHRRLKLPVNFISRETSTDVILSCHFAVMLIVYMRDNFPQEDCQLDDTGSDVVEDFWSKNGQWVGNHHNYTFGELRRNTSHMIRLEEIRVDPSAPDFAKPHPKQESIWGQQCERPINVANLKEYPAIGTEIEAWKEGIKIARRLARSVGMIPDIDAVDEDNNDDGNDDNDGHDGSEGDDGCLDNNVRGRNQHNERNAGREDYWFYRPFECLENTFRSNQDENDGDHSCSPTVVDEDDISDGGPTISGKATIFQYSRT